MNKQKGKIKEEETKQNAMCVCLCVCYLLIISLNCYLPAGRLSVKVKSLSRSHTHTKATTMQINKMQFQYVTNRKAAFSLVVFITNGDGVFNCWNWLGFKFFFVCSSVNRSIVSCLCLFVRFVCLFISNFKWFTAYFYLSRFWTRC